MNKIDIVVPIASLSTINVHESAKLNPPMDNTVFNNTMESIKENGQTVPVLLFKENVDTDSYILVDGRNRLEIIKKLHRDLKAVVLENCSLEDAINHAKSLNDDRRSMTQSMLAMRVAKEIISSRVDKDGKDLPRNKWLKINNHSDIKKNKVSASNVEKAIKITKNNPSIAEKIRLGTLSIQQADRQIKEKKQNTKTLQVALNIVNTPDELEANCDQHQERRLEQPFVEDANLSSLEADYNTAAVEKYKTYIDKEGPYTIESLAYQLIVAEEKINELKKTSL